MAFGGDAMATCFGAALQTKNQWRRRGEERQATAEETQPDALNCGVVEAVPALATVGPAGSIFHAPHIAPLPRPAPQLPPHLAALAPPGGSTEPNVPVGHN